MSISDRILFRNENLLVVLKLPGELTVPGRFKDQRPVLGYRLQEHLGQKIFPVHRLDYEVGGLVVFALNNKSHQIAQSWFEKKTILKKYSAITSQPEFSFWPEQYSDQLVKEHFPDFGEKQLWTSKILRGKKRSFISDGGDRAETQAQLVKKINEKYLLWHLEPKTGRAHQLRLELARRGCPILGDLLYGSPQVLSGKKNWIEIFEIEENKFIDSDSFIALWAYQIELNFEERLGLPTVIKTDIPWDVTC